MSGTNQKRSRKSKLVPRTFKDGNESDNLQIKSRKKLPTKHINNTVEQTPTTSTYQPLQFDIKIEVEECDIADFNSTTGLIPDCEIKTEIINENDLFEIEERDINSLLAQGLSKKRGQLSYDYERVGSTIGLNNDHNYSPKDEDKPKLEINEKRQSNIPIPKSLQLNSVYHLQLAEETIFESLDELHNGNMSLADKILGIEMRNLWGRCRMLEHVPTVSEKNIQIALDTLKYSHKGWEVPLMYKCYVCEKAWWHLGPFQEHLEDHEEELHVESESQFGTTQHNIVAYSSKSNNVYKDFSIDSNCWRCGYGFEHHLKHETLYLCEHCLQTFQSCMKHKAHEAECVRKLRVLIRNGPIVLFKCHICKLNLLNKETLENHYSDYHNVRSDLPMFIDVRNCMTCSNNYASLQFHHCIKKNYSITCPHCLKRYPSKLALEIHLDKESNYMCTICGVQLPMKCMVVEHMLKHTDKFIMLHKCLSCKDNILLFNEESMKRHKTVWHKQKVYRRRNFFEMVLVPKRFFETQQLEEFDMSGSMKNSAVKSEHVIEEEKKIDAPLEVIEVDLETDSNPEEVLDVEDNDNSSASNTIRIKQEEEDEEFDDLNDSIVKEKMIEEMQKNNSFTEDDEGYEFILSSVFNASNTKMLEAEIADEADDFEELINKELQKSKEKFKPKRSLETNATETKPSDRKECKVKIAMNTKLEKVEPERAMKAVSEKLKCDYRGCDFNAYNKLNLKSHKEDHKAIIISCSKCKESFRSIQRYLEHLTHHGYTKSSCPDCLRIYSGYSSLANHVRIKAIRSFSKTVNKSGGNKISVTYKCKKCKAIVPREFVIGHWETHLGVSDSIVKVEIEDNDIEIDIGQDQNVEMEIDQNSGIECGQNGEIEYGQPSDGLVSDLTPAVMTKVIRALVEKNSRRSDCKTCIACGRAFDRRNDCKRHHIQHLLTNAYGTKILYQGLRCQICHKVYERPDAYKYHMRCHGHLPVYKCSLCFKTFSDSSNYVKHQKTHGSMFICDICKKKFQIKKSLIRHMQCHTTEPINCIFCPKVFFMESDFSRHVRNAHNQRLFKYSCIICKKKFKSTKDKWDHMWIEHKERQVKADCPVCSAEFRKITDVKKHLKAEHDMEISVMNMRAFRQILQTMKEGNEVDDGNEMVTVKREDEKMPYIVLKSEDNSKRLQFFNKNDILSVMNNEFLKDSSSSK